MLNGINPVNSKPVSFKNKVPKITLKDYQNKLEGARNMREIANSKINQNISPKAQEVLLNIKKEAAEHWNKFIKNPLGG